MEEVFLSESESRSTRESRPKLWTIGTSSTSRSTTRTPIGRRATPQARRRQREESGEASTPGEPNGRQKSLSPTSKASGGINVIVASSETSSEKGSTGPSIRAGAKRDARSGRRPRNVG